MNLLIFITFYILITLSIIGYGLIFGKIIYKKNTLEIGQSGIFGIFFITFLAYLTNFFLPLSNQVNLAIHFIGIVSFFYFFKKKNYFNKKELITLIFTILIVIFFILSAKPHDDFPYYHFPYINLLNNENLQIGIGNFNHGFRTSSSIFYFSSTFYLPIIKYEIIHIGSAFFLIFANLILLKKLIIDKNKYNKFILILALLSFSMINIFFYRIGEHGTDKSAQILMILFVIEILIILNYKKINLENVSFAIILIILAASLKVIYLIYLLFFLTFIYYTKNKIKFILEIVRSKIFVFSSVFIIFVISVNFFNTGCLLYPAPITCFENIYWSIAPEEVNEMNKWYQLWAKAGATPIFRTNNPEEYISNFYWVSNWLNNYFFNKVSDYILGLFFLSIIILITFYKINKSSFLTPKYLLIYSLVIVLFITWFINHPSLRYGGYHLISLILFIPFSVHLSKNTYNNKKFYSKIILIISIISLIFVARNVQRISKENEVYNYNFLKNPSYVEKFENHELYSKINATKKCNIDNCVEATIFSKKIFGRYIFFKKR